MPEYNYTRKLKTPAVDALRQLGVLRAARDTASSDLRNTLPCALACLLTLSLATAAVSIRSLPAAAKEDQSVAGVVNKLIEQGSADPDAPIVTKAVYSKAADQCVKAYFNGNKAVAEKSFKEVLSSVKDSYDSVISVMTQIHGRVVMYSAEEDTPKCYGLCMYESMVAATEKSLGPNHPAVAAALNLIAKYYEDKREYQQAIVVRERQVKILRRSKAMDLLQAQTALQDLGYDYFLSKNYKFAARLLDENIAVCQRKGYAKLLRNGLRLRAEIKKLPQGGAGAAARSN